MADSVFAGGDTGFRSKVNVSPIMSLVTPKKGLIRAGIPASIRMPVIFDHADADDPASRFAPRGPCPQGGNDDYRTDEGEHNCH